MKIQTKHYILNRNCILNAEELAGLNIDKKLEDDFNNRDKYNIIKRIIIENKYANAVEKAIRDQYYNASNKVD